MATKNYIPASNKDFNDFQDNFVTVVNIYILTWNLSPAAILEWKLLTDTVGKKKKRWDDIWAIVKTKVFNHAQEIEMLEARKDYESGVRKDAGDTSLRLFISRYIRNNPLVTNEQKGEMGLTVPVDKLDPYVHGFHPGNDLSGKIKKATYLVHYNQVSVPGQKSKAKGAGVENIHVFISITEASVKTVPDISTFVYDGMVKRGKYVRQFDISQEGKRVWYIVRIMFKGKDQRYSSPSEPWDGIIM